MVSVHQAGPVRASGGPDASGPTDPTGPVTAGGPHRPGGPVGRDWRPLLPVLLVVLLPLSLLAPLRDPVAGTWWPSNGMAAAALLLAGRHWRAQAAVVAGVVAVVTPTVVAAYDAPVAGAVLSSLAVLAPALTVALLLRPRPTGTGDDRPRRAGPMPDFATARYHLAVPAAAGTCGLAVLLLSSLQLAPGAAVQLSAASALGALTALLVVLPVVASTPGRPASGGPTELWAQRSLLLAGGLGLLVLPLPAALFTAAFPVLGWAALRASRREAMVQVLAFSVVAYAASVLDLGASSPPGNALPPALQPVPLHLFLASLSYLLVPLALTVERLSLARVTAVRNAAAVERMLDGTTTTLLLVSDGKGVLTRYNEGARRILGHRPEDVLGRPPTIFHTDAEVARHAEELGVTPDLRSVVARQVRLGTRRDWDFVCADGGVRTVSLGFTVVRDPEQRVALVVASGEDVTERLREQRAMQAALAREHESVRRLQEVDHVKQELVSNVSHELRTPITSIAGYAELLSDGSLGELTRAQRDAVRRIERNAIRLQALVDDLLTLSRSESGRLQLSRTPMDLRDVVRTAWELFDQQLRQRDLEARLVLPSQPVEVFADAQALERVVVNLVANAVKFTPDGGAVTVTVSRRADGSARLTVQDTGIGIATEDQERLFTRFFRARQASDQAIQGTGLGLSIVQALVSQHGGQVSLRSQLGEGTRVTVELPGT